MKFMVDSCEAGRLLCATLSQLEAEEDESFREKESDGIHKSRRSPCYFGLLACLHLLIGT